MDCIFKESHLKLNQFRCDGKYCDVNIQVQGQVFSCHRAVLASTSEYFDSMLSGKFVESRCNEIVLHEIESSSFETVLQSIYTGKKPTLTVDTVCGVLFTSEFLRLDSVRNRCVEFILKNKSSINLFQVFTLACSTYNKILVDALSELIVNDLTNFVKKDEFLKLQYEDLLVILKKYREGAKYRAENFLLDALIRWFHYSGPARQTHFRMLVKMIDFEKISPEYIEVAFKEYKINSKIMEDLKNNFNTKDPLTLGIICDGFVANQPNTSDCHALPVPYEDPYFSKQSLTLHVYFRQHVSGEYCPVFEYTTVSLNKDKVEPEWSVSCRFRKSSSSNYSSRKLITFATLDNSDNLYCVICDEISLEEEALAVPSFQLYSSVHLGSESQTLSIIPRNWEYCDQIRMCGVGSNTIYSYIYNTCYSSISHSAEELAQKERASIYSYICDIDTWSPVPEMRTKMIRSYLLTSNNLIYLVGGLPSRNSMPVAHGYVQAFDYRSPKWLEIPTTANSYTGPISGCSANGKLYISNGVTMETFDQIAGRWETVNMYPTVGKRRQMELEMVPYDSKLWIFNKKYGTTIDIYDLSSQQWSESSSVYDIKSLGNHCSLEVENVVVFKPLEKVCSTSGRVGDTSEI